MGFKGTERQVFVIPDVIKDKVVESPDPWVVRRSVRKALFDLFKCFPDQDTFSERDMKEMSKWKAAYCEPSQKYEWQNKMSIHHLKVKRDFEDKTKANLIDNLVIVSPLYHMTAILTNIAHFWYFRGTKKNNEEEDREKKKRESVQ